MNKTNNIPTLRFPEFKGNWEMKKLGEMCDNISSGKDKPNDGNQFPVFGSMGIIGYSDKYAYQNKTILIARVGANAGALNIADGKFGVTDNTLVIKIDYSIDIYFLFYRLTFENLNKLVFGSGQPLITAGQLKNIEIPIPTLAEQEKIANFLTAVDEKIQALKKKKSLLENYKKGLMQKLFSQTLRFKDEHGNDFANWEVKKLGEVCEITIGEFVIKTKQNPNGKYPVYNGGITPTGFYDDFNNEGNKIIISARGANAGFVNFQKEKYWAGNSCYSIDVLNKSNFRILFFYYFIKMFQNRFVENQQAANIPSVSKKDAELFEINLPCLAEQTKIANFLSSIDSKIGHCQTSIVNYERWKKGLLQRLFV